MFREKEIGKDYPASLKHFLNIGRLSTQQATTLANSVLVSFCMPSNVDTWSGNQKAGHCEQLNTRGFFLNFVLYLINLSATECILFDSTDFPATDTRICNNTSYFSCIISLRHLESNIGTECWLTFQLYSSNVRHLPSSYCNIL